MPAILAITLSQNQLSATPLSPWRSFPLMTLAFYGIFHNMLGRLSKINLFPGIALTLVFAVAVFVRMLPYRNFIDESGQFLFYGPDSYDHLRQISLSVRYFPEIPTFDYYRGYPQGTGMVWSPLFDVTIALIALIAGIGNPSTYQVEAVSFFISPIFGALTIFPFYFLVKRIFDGRTALLGALILCIIPGHMMYSFVAQTDHHVIEPILALVFFISFLSAVSHARSLEEEHKYYIRDIGWLLKAIFAGVTMALILFYWRGSTIFWGAIMIFALLQSILDIRYLRPYRYLYGTTILAFMTAAIILSVFCLVNPWKLPLGVSFGVISWFHPLLILGYMLFLSLFVFAQKMSREYNIFKIPWMWAAVLTILLLVMSLIVSISPFLKSLLEGVRVIKGGDPWLDSIMELRSILYPDRRIDLLFPVSRLTWTFWLSPFLLLYLTYRAYEQRFKDPYLSFFLIWTPYALLMAVFRERYAHIAALGVSALSAYFFFQILEKTKRYKHYGAAFSLIALALIIYPVSSHLKALSNERPEGKDLFEAMKWMKANTPKTSHYDYPVIKPEYGIMAEWSIGSYIEYLSERPAIATNFGWETYGLMPSVLFITATSEETANDILDKNSARYIVIHKDPIDQLFNAGEILGLNRSEYVSEDLKYGHKVPETMIIRLYMFDGASSGPDKAEIPALEHYRLVYESSNFMKHHYLSAVTSVTKIFEYVRGVKVTGYALAGEHVYVESIIETGSRRQFIYRNSAKAGREGVFELTVPYSTVGTPYAARAIGPYSISIGNKKILLDIAEEDVINGKVINISSTELAGLII